MGKRKSSQAGEKGGDRTVYSEFATARTAAKRVEGPSERDLEHDTDADQEEVVKEAFLRHLHRYRSNHLREGLNKRKHHTTTTDGSRSPN